MHKIIYNCRLCGRRGIASASELCPPDQIDIFAKGLCCNPCFDAREKRNKYEGKIMRAAHFLIASNTEEIGDHEKERLAKRQKIRDRALQVFNECARPWCEAVCELHLVAFTYDPEMPDIIYTSGNKVSLILKQYEDGIIAMKATA